MRGLLNRPPAAVMACMFAASVSIFFVAGAMADELDAFQGLEGRLDIAGGTAHIPVMTDAAKRIMRANPRIRITVAGGGSGVGVQKVGQGLVDVGNTGRPVSDEEQKKFGLVSFPFAIDGVAVIVHPSNRVAGLTAKQAQDIFAGKIITLYNIFYLLRSTYLKLMIFKH